LAKPKKSGWQRRKEAQALEFLVSRLLREPDATAVREQMRQERASHKGNKRKTQFISNLEDAWACYLAWIGKPKGSATEIIADVDRFHDLRRADETEDAYSLRDDPVERELREALWKLVQPVWFADFKKQPGVARALELLAQGWTIDRIDELNRKHGRRLMSPELRGKLEIAAKIQNAKPQKRKRRHAEAGQRKVWKR
jgi:hypothetical protein